MKESILVSIAVPIFGVEKYIERCAISLFEQTYQNIEYVFVNDCTKDNSIHLLNSIINRYPKRKPFVKVINHEFNRGLGNTRNTAINNCRGDFVLSVDSDDWLELDAVEKLIEKQVEENADIVYGNIILNDNIRSKNFMVPDCKNKDQLLIHVLSQEYHHEVCSRLIKRSLYIDYNIKVEDGCNVGEDWQVLPRLIYYAKKISFINTDIYHYFIENESSTIRRKKDYDLWKNYYLNEAKSLSILNRFYINKEEKYRKAISFFSSHRIYDYMLVAVCHNDSTLFYSLKESLLSCDLMDLRKSIGNNNGIILRAKLSYTLQRIKWIMSNSFK